MRGDIEGRLSRHLAAGEVRIATSLAVETYGPELLGFLEATTLSTDEAHEIYARTLERVWKGVSKFQGRGSFRVWLYTIAANERRRLRTEKGRWVRLSTASAAGLRDRSPRRSTAPHRRSGPKQVFRSLREKLSEEDQVILVLRIDRQLTWDEIAHIQGTPGPTLRKRFERLKRKLFKLARDPGIGLFSELHDR